jgi:hypothetical protein
VSGSYSRRKGHNHERDVATKLREAFPNATVRRSDQGFGAKLPDVVIEGDAPYIATRIWWECQRARKCYPLKKLDQAVRDIAKTGKPWVPVCVWKEDRKAGEKQARPIMVTWRDVHGIVRELPFDEYLRQLKETVKWSQS